MLSRDQISILAELARLELSEAEHAALQQEVGDILALVERMAGVDCTGVEPMAHPQEAMQRLREDRATEPDASALFQAIAPRVEDGLYLVPRVVE
jgi:aspartyl-tRNA(Asn)/glutamyl-tRNA(Gln) amidotransferase subunit C